MTDLSKITIAGARDAMRAGEVTSVELTQNYLDLGTQLGVDAVIVGNIEGFGISYKPKSTGLFLSPLVTKVSFAVRCVVVTTNETIWTVKIKGSSTEDNERALSSRLRAESCETRKTI